MNINKIRLIQFSPTGTSADIVSAIAEGFAPALINRLDLTFAEAKAHRYELAEDELAVIGMPVYAGRLPMEAVYRLRQIKAHNTPAILVVVYGNRAYDDALIELRDLAQALGFVPVAAGAFIGEHSFATASAPIAMHRPDAADLKQAGDFGRSVRQMLDQQQSLQQIPSVSVPGNVPYMEHRVLQNLAPISDEASCSHCNTCLLLCPTGAMTQEGRNIVTDASLCILCCACVKHCPHGARQLNDGRIEKLRGMLTSKFSARKEPEIFMPSA